MRAAAEQAARPADPAADTDAALSRLARATDMAEAAADEEEAIAALRPLFEDLAWIAAIARSAAKSLRADPFHLFGLTAMTSGTLQQVLLASGPRASVTLGTLGRMGMKPVSVPATHAFVGNRSLLRLLSEEPLEGRLAVLSRANGTCRDRPITVHPGRLFDMDERRRVLWIAAPERQALFLRARMRRSPAPLVRTHRVGERQPRNLANGDDGLARSLAMIAMLRALGTAPPMEALRALMPRAHGTQRWTLMREMLALDTGAAFSDLNAMASDDADPALRAVAGRLVARLEESAPCRS